MAEAFDQLLLKMGIDLAPAKAGITELKNLLGSVSELLGQLKTQSASAIEVQGQAISQIKAAAEASSVASKQAIADENVKAAAIGRETAELKKQAQEYATTVAQTKEGIAAEQLKRAAIEAASAEIRNQAERQRLITAELQKQTAEYRKQRIEQSDSHGEGGEKGLGNLAGKVAGAVLGRGLAGSVATGVLAGQGIGYFIEQSVEGIARFIDKLKEMQDQASQMTLIQNQFEGLAKAAGIDGAQAIDKMRIATEGLVSKMDLMKTANTALKSPFGLDIDKVTQLEGAVVKLAEANGHTAVQAIEALNQAMTSGRSQQLMFITGLSRIAGQLENVSASAGRVERGSLQMGHAFELITAQANALGEMPQTLQQMMTRLAVSWHDLLLEFGRGFNLSAGTQSAITLFKQLTDSITGAGPLAERLGDALGKVFFAVVAGMQSALPIFKQLSAIITDLAQLVGGLFSTAIDNIHGLGGEVSDASKEFSELHPVLDTLLTAFENVNHQIEGMLIRLRHIADWFVDNKGIFGAIAGGVVGGPVGALTGGALTTDREQLKNRAVEAARRIKAEREGTSSGVFGGVQKEYPYNFVGPIPPETVRAKPTVQEELDRSDEQAAFEQQQRRELFLQQEEEGKRARGGITPVASNDVERQSEINRQLELEKKLEESKTQLQMDEAKTRLEQHLLELQTMKEQDTAAYQDGEELLKTHLNKQIALETEAFNARRQNSFEQMVGRANKLQEQMNEVNKRFEGESKQPGANVAVLSKAHDTEVETIRNQMKDNLQKFASEMTAEQTKYLATIFNLNRQGAKADLDARRKEINDQLQIEREGIAKRLALQEQQVKQSQETTERSLSVGEVSPEQYYQQRIQQIEELAAVQRRAADETQAAQQKQAIGLFQTNAKSPEAARAFIDSIHKSSLEFVDAVNKDTQAAIGSLQALSEKEIQIREQSIQRQYQPQIGAIQGQIQGLQNVPGSQGQIADLTGALAEKLDEQKTQLLGLLDLTKPYSDDWYRVYQSVVRVNDEWVKSIQQLNQMRDLMQPIAAGFQAIGQGISANFQSHFAQSLAESVTAGAKSVQQSTILGQRIRGGPAENTIDPRMKALEDQASGLFTSVGSASDKVRGPFEELAAVCDLVIEKFQKLAGVPQSDLDQQKIEDQERQLPVGRQGDWDVMIGQEETIPGAKTGSSSSGGGFSKTLTSLADKFGAAVEAVSNFTAAILHARSAIGGAAGGATSGLGLGNTITSAFDITGTLGNIIPGAGAVLGGITGAITGAKNNQVINNINKVQQEFKDVMQQFAMNTNNLQQTIQQVAGLIAQLQEMQANSKKGGQQYAQAIQQYIDQMNQLLAQQHQVIVNMNEALAIANAPLAAQSFLGDLQSIFQTFQQNAGAAQTVQDLANAYALLNAQLQTYTENEQQTLLQNNQQAIQDALQLNDLLFQQWQDQLQFNQQVQQILSQGVLVRTPTRAMTAGSEIYSLQVTYQRQQQQLQEQIDAATFRVQQEQTIFNLATTRIGLENQLLQAQNAQTLLDMTRITMLQATLQAIATGDYSLLPGLSDLIAAIPQSTIAANASGAVSTEATVQTGLAQAYQTRSMMGYAQYRAQNIGL